MNRIKSIIAISAFSLLILGIPTVASGQWNGGPYNGNNGGYYGNDSNLRSAVRDLKNRAKEFNKITDGRGYNRNSYDPNLERLADQFWNAADRLEERFGNGRNMNNSAGEARRVLDLASQIDNQIGYSNTGYGRRGGNGGYGNYGGYGNSNAVGTWNAMRYDLQTIANAYGYGYNNNGGGYRNNRSNRNGRYWPF